MPKDGMGLPPYEQARVVDAYARTALDAALAAGLSLDCAPDHQDPEPDAWHMP